MSAGMMPAAAEPQPSRNLDLLAPKVRAAVQAAIAECNAPGGPGDVLLYEAMRSAELQAIYYARGRTVKPPYQTVTNAKSNLYSWHGFGLAVDVVHRILLWSPPAAWWHAVAKIFKKHGLDWGGDWHQVDLPHFQWGTLRKSPSDRARQLLADGGLAAVWKEVGADGPPVPAVLSPQRARILTLGLKGDDVAELQLKLGVPVTRVFDADTDARVRAVQRRHGLAVDGDVGPKTRAVLGL